MLTTNLTTVHRCRSCGSERLKKNGHNASGSQRARCLECHCTFVLEPKPPRYSEEERQRIVRAATCERLSTRAIHRTFGPCYQTLRRWVQKRERVLAVGGLVPAHSPDCCLHAGRPLGRKRPVAAKMPAARLPLPRHAQRSVAFL